MGGEVEVWSRGDAFDGWIEKAAKSDRADAEGGEGGGRERRDEYMHAREGVDFDITS
jgi:hypothetical protein